MIISTKYTLQFLSKKHISHKVMNAQVKQEGSNPTTPKKEKT
jgi:hypothetical protein